VKKVFLFLTFMSVAAGAQLRLDCSRLTPKDLVSLKSAPTQDPCTEKGTAIVAMTSTDVLYTCLNSITVQRYDISTGRGGVGKTREGDLKTPLGVYPRLFACAGALNVSVNWTQGCLAVADDHFIVEIAAFVKSHPGVLLYSLE
jgi:hypothetical protein